MAEANAVIGQTYNATQQKVYPKVVPESFVKDSTVEGGTTDVFDTIIRDTIDKFDIITPKRIGFSDDGGIEIHHQDNVRNFLSINSEGQIQIESENISDSIGNNGWRVNIFRNNIVVDASTVRFFDGSVIMDSSLLLITQKIEATNPSSMITAHSISATDIQSNSIRSDSASITYIDSSIIKSDDITIKEYFTPLKQVKELPYASEDYAEEIVQYIGPTDHDSEDGINKYSYLRCVMDYTIDTEPDSSVYIIADYDSFEPYTTYKWLIDNDIKCEDVEVGNYGKRFEFNVKKENGTYVVYVENNDGVMKLLGEDTDHTVYDACVSKRRYIYSPYVWNIDYDTEETILYSIIFYPYNYSWKPTC